MIQSNYRKISEERTSVRFAVNGVDHHHAYREAEWAFRVSGVPDSLKTLEDRLVEDDAVMVSSAAFGMESTSVPQRHTGNQGAFSHNQRSARGRYRGRGTWYRNLLQKETT